MCVSVWRRVKGGGIPVSFKAEEEKLMEEGVYVEARLCRQNVLHLLFVWIGSVCYSL